VTRAERRVTIRDPDIAAILRVVARQTGLVFSPSRVTPAEQTVGRWMQRHGIDAAAVGDGIFERDREAFDSLVAELTVGETYFFREPEQLAFIRRTVLPDLGARHERRGVRVWSAGCASGEEAYSLAILLHETGMAPEAEVLGTDISRARIAVARRGCYAPWSLRGVPDEVVSRYFRRRDGKYKLAPVIRSMASFRYQNLPDGTGAPRFSDARGADLILCRNVLIYFDRDAVTRAAHRLLAALDDDGWLFLGASDPPLADLVPCEVVMTEAGVAYRRQPARQDIAPRPVTGFDLFAPVPNENAPGVPVPHESAPEASTPTTPPTSGGSAEELTPAHSLRYAARDYERAADLATIRVREDARDERAWVTLVRALANLGRLADAGRACAAALESHRMSPELVHLHAALLGSAGRHAEAAMAARRALYLDRTLSPAHLLLGASLARLGDVAGARRALRNAERLLAALPANAPVAVADGQPAGRLLADVRAHLRLLGEEVS
jgi:chemotaxis protein methyltransferase CheR